MLKLKNKMLALTNVFIGEKSGFSIVELMVVIGLLAIILGMGLTLYVFGISTHVLGEEQTDVQQNARLVSDFITDEIRMAEKGTILASYDKDKTAEDLKDFLDEDIGYRFDENHDENHHVYFIFEHEDSIYYQEVDGVDDPVEYVEGISRDIIFDLEFERSDDKKNILNVKLTATHITSGRNYHLETEIEALNLDALEKHEDVAAGKAIVYQIPAPPEPSLEVPSIEPSRYMIYGSEEEKTVNVQTNRVDDGKEVTAKFYKEDEEGSTIIEEIDIELVFNESELTIQDNQSTFEFFLREDTLSNKGLYFSDFYYLEVDVDSVNYSRRANIPVQPSIDITTEDHPSQSHWGDVKISTIGVPDGTAVDAELLDAEGNLIDFVMQAYSGDGDGDGDGNLVVEESDQDVDTTGKAYFEIHEDEAAEDEVDDINELVITIGNKVKRKEIFHIAEINIYDKDDQGEDYDGDEDLRVEVITGGEFSEQYEGVTLTVELLEIVEDEDEDEDVDVELTFGEDGDVELTFDEDGNISDFYFKFTGDYTDDYYDKDFNLKLFIDNGEEPAYEKEFRIEEPTS